MPASYWLLKSDDAYPWDELVAEGRTEWTGIRNYEARNHLQAMRPGDLALYYHSGKQKAVVGIARVVRAAQPDPTADEPGWVSVEISPVEPLGAPVTLAQIKADPALREMSLVTRPRLSVIPVVRAHFDRVRALGRGAP